MMLILTDRRNYENICDTIREIAGIDDMFLPSEISDAIRRMSRMASPTDAVSTMTFDVVCSSSAPTTMAVDADATYTFPMDITMATRAERG